VDHTRLCKQLAFADEEEDVNLVISVSDFDLGTIIPCNKKFAPTPYGVEANYGCGGDFRPLHRRTFPAFLRQGSAVISMISSI
jgi:hypothetical protein